MHCLREWHTPLTHNMSIHAVDLAMEDGGPVHCLDKPHHSKTTNAHYRVSTAKPGRKHRFHRPPFNTNCTDNSELCSSPGTINHQLSCPMLYVPIVLKLSELSSNLNRVSCMRISCHKKHHQLPLFNIVSCCQTVQLTYLRG